MELPVESNELQDLQTLSILTLIEPILETTSRRSSQTTNAHPQQTDSTPASLITDLSHYQELFSKLRFSYVEQVTKECFLRAVTSDPPSFVTAIENTELEGSLKQNKAALKEKKLDVRGLIGALEEQGRELARRYERVQLQTTQLNNLPVEIERLHESIEILKQRQEPEAKDPEMRMPLQRTRDTLHKRREEIADMDSEIERLRAALPAKKSEVQRLQDELEPIRIRKTKAEDEAQEAKRRRENGGMADELDEKARWLRGVESSLRAMLEI